MKKTTLLLVTLLILCATNAQGQNLGSNTNDGTQTSLHGIDISSNFPVDSLEMEEAFHWIKRHFFTALRVLEPQPPLFYEMSERYRFLIFDTNGHDPFPWKWQPGNEDDPLILENFSPLRVEFIDIHCQDRNKKVKVTNGFDFALPEGVDLIYEADNRGEKITGVIPLAGIAAGESQTVEFAVPPHRDIYSSYKISIVAGKPFDGFREGDFLSGTQGWATTN